MVDSLFDLPEKRLGFEVGHVRGSIDTELVDRPGEEESNVPDVRLESVGDVDLQSSSRSQNAVYLDEKVLPTYEMFKNVRCEDLVHCAVREGEILPFQVQNDIDAGPADSVDVDPSRPDVLAASEIEF